MIRLPAMILPFALIWVLLVSGYILLTKEQCPPEVGLLTSVRTEAEADRYVPSCRSRMPNLVSRTAAGADR